MCTADPSAFWTAHAPQILAMIKEGAIAGRAVLLAGAPGAPNLAVKFSSHKRRDG